jgi:hypothetical protein
MIVDIQVMKKRPPPGQRGITVQHALDEPQEVSETANLRQSTTGLPFVVWISPRAGARHGVRVKVSVGPHFGPEQRGGYALRPFRHVDGPRLNQIDEALLERWADANQDVLVAYWDGTIPFTQDAINKLAPV